MTDTAISGLSAAGTLADANLFEVVQSGANKKGTLAQIGTYIASLFGLVKNNTAASSDPGATDDTAHGYSTRSFWMNTATGSLWACVDPTNNAAKWMRLSPGGAFAGYASGNWYPSVPEAILANGSALSANNIRFHPFLIREKVTLSDLGARHSTQAAGNIQLAVYAMNMTTRRPTGNALAATGSISVNVAANAINGAISGGNVAFNPGWHFMALNVDSGAGGTVSMSQIAASCNFGGGVMGSTTQANIAGGQASGGFFLTLAQTFGTWPDVTGQTFLEAVSSLSFHGDIKVA